MDNLNYSMLTDFYEITMSNGYYLSKMKDKICYFDVFYRTIPDGGGFGIFAGLEQVIDYVKNLRFSDEDIKYLRAKKMFSEEYLTFLKEFRFTGDIYSVPEGTVVFPNEPVMTVRAKAIEAQFVETYLLLCLNHQSLIATKAKRICTAAENRPVMEFGSRRAQGPGAAIFGARASYIGGCVGTACTIADRLFGVPALGTMAHSWVQMFDSEYEAFKTYVELYPTNACLLVDTYDTLKSGIPNAIKIFKELLWPKGIHNYSIRIDSGDITYLTKKARKMLNEAGLPECKIVVSNALDERVIRQVLLEGAVIDSFGVGEKLITAKSDPIFGYVYKLVAIEEEGKITPKIKISENSIKTTTPGFKKIYRIYDKDTGIAMADLICLKDETIDTSKPLTIFDPVEIWKEKTFENYELRELLIPIFINGKQVYTSPNINEIKGYCTSEVAKLWDEVKRFDKPHTYYVDLSIDLYNLKQKMIGESRKSKQLK